MVARSKTIKFWRPQIGKFLNYYLKPKFIHKLMNQVNGPEHQITLEVFFATININLKYKSISTFIFLFKFTELEKN